MLVVIIIVDAIWNRGVLMEKHRCIKCNKLLFIGKFTGKIEILCPRCKMKNLFDIKNK